MTLIKFCGFTRVEDAKAAVRLGVDAVGFNFFAGSPRHVSAEIAHRMAQALEGTDVIKVGIFVNHSESAIRDTALLAGLDQLQLHGDEPPKLVRELLPAAYKAFRVRDETVLTQIRFYPHSLFLLDAYVEDQYGGSGVTFRWDIAREAGELGRVILAGGLTPENVGAAIRACHPAMVDVAGGIESQPGIKDPAKMAAFIAAVRKADATLDDERKGGGGG